MALANQIARTICILALVVLLGSLARGTVELVAYCAFCCGAGWVWGASVA